MKMILSLILFFILGFKYQNSSLIKTIELVPGISAYDDYDEGIEYAKEVKKPVLIYFRDRRSANCIKFEKNIFSNDKIKNYLNKKFVVVCLLVDDNTAYTKPGKNFKTKADYNNYIEETVFQSDSQPHSALLNKQNEFIKGFDYTSDPKEYLKFLRTLEK